MGPGIIKLGINLSNYASFIAHGVRRRWLGLEANIIALLDFATLISGVSSLLKPS